MSLRDYWLWHFIDLWSFPDRLWLRWHAPRNHESKIINCYPYLCIDPVQMRECRDLYGPFAESESFLLALLDNSYRPLLEEGYAIPFAMVFHLAVGYTFGQVTFSPLLEEKLSKTNRNQGGETHLFVKYIEQLNFWLRDSQDPRFAPEKANQDRFTDEEIAQLRKRRANWVSLNGFIRLMFSNSDLGDENFRIDPQVCDSNKVRENLFSRAILGRGVEPRLVKGYFPTPSFVEYKLLEKYFSKVSEKLAHLSQTSNENKPQEILLSKVKRRSTLYLERAGRTRDESVSDDLREMDLENISSFITEQQIDLRALANYQMYGKFDAVTESEQLAEWLYYRANDPEVVHQTRESTVDGITRRGQLYQALKWQLGLPEPVVYERFFNNKMLYMKRISSKTQQTRITLLFLIDISDSIWGYTSTYTLRPSSIFKEVCAYFAQDFYHKLWQIPQLYANAVFIFYADSHVVWRSVVTLTEGNLQRPIPDDLFLLSPPHWLRAYETKEPFKDPPTYFQWLTPQWLPASWENEASLLDQVEETLDDVESAYKMWYRNKTGSRRTNTDLLITVTAAESDSSDLPDFELLGRFGTIHHLWNVTYQPSDHKIGLKPINDFTSKCAHEVNQDLNDFRSRPNQSDADAISHSLRDCLLLNALSALTVLHSSMET